MLQVVKCKVMLSTAEKNIIAQRLSSRAETGAYFVEFEYLARHKTPDLAWIRNIYILLSFHTELLLKGIYVYTNDFDNLDKLEFSLRKAGHNLKILGEMIGTDNLLIFGINQISNLSPGYLIETKYGNFKVEDFIDIRYDFIDGKTRTLYGNEHELFSEQIKIMHQINAILTPLVYK